MCCILHVRIRFLSNFSWSLESQASIPEEKWASVFCVHGKIYWVVNQISYAISGPCVLSIYLAYEHELFVETFQFLGPLCSPFSCDFSLLSMIKLAKNGRAARLWALLCAALEIEKRNGQQQTTQIHSGWLLLSRSNDLRRPMKSWLNLYHIWMENVGEKRLLLLLESMELYSKGKASALLKNYQKKSHQESSKSHIKNKWKEQELMICAIFLIFKNKFWNFITCK